MHETHEVTRYLYPALLFSIPLPVYFFIHLFIRSFNFVYRQGDSLLPSASSV